MGDSEQLNGNIKYNIAVTYTVWKNTYVKIYIYLLTTN